MAKIGKRVSDGGAVTVKAGGGGAKTAPTSEKRRATREAKKAKA